MGPISGAFQSTNALTILSKRQFSRQVHWGGNGRAANLPCFHHAPPPKNVGRLVSEYICRLQKGFCIFYGNNLLLAKFQIL